MYIRIPFQQLKLVGLLTLAFIAFNVAKTQAKSTQVAGSQVRFIPPPVPSQDIPTGRRRGGATRCPECQDNVLSLAALVPGSESKSSLALTISKYPTFWFYLSYRVNAPRILEFVLQDEEDNYIYKTVFRTSETPTGIVSVSVPTSGLPLEIGKIYHWTFVLHYNPQQLSEYVVVSGSIQRVAPSPQLTHQLEQVKLQKYAALYATNGIWYDALTTLAMLRRKYPQDAGLTANWIQLLQSVGLGDLATKPIAQCCNPKDQQPYFVQPYNQFPTRI